jgi:tetratricopeptide (TPR) repeat protein
MERKAREIIGPHPRSGLAWKALGVALQRQGQAATAALERAAELLPNDVEVHSNLAAALRQAGRLDAALSSVRRALQLRPDVAEVWNNLGNIQIELGCAAAAIESFHQALVLKPDLAKAHNNLGNAHRELGDLDSAVASYRRAIAIVPHDADAHNNLAIALRLQSSTAEAESSCRRALELDPTHTGAIETLAELTSDAGDFAGAERLYRRAKSLDPCAVEAWAGIARLKRMTQADGPWLAEALRLVEQGLPARREVHLRYALGKYYDDVGEYAAAFAQVRRANELAQRGRPVHDRSQVTRSIDRLIRSHDRPWLERVRVEANRSERPVFIVGMPRSGTTLAEQILASHSAVAGAGELPFWNTAAGRLSGGETDPGTLRGVAQEYLAVLEGVSSEAGRVVDKMPGNFLYLGLIHAALPQARIIHMQRDARDTCLSIYFQNFGAVHSYANDLEDLAHYHGEYERLMQHWRASLPARVLLDVPYEGLVQDVEGWSRRMLEFLGLPWEAQCLEFHRSARPVSTFSKWQARQRIHTSSVARWRHYQDFLGPWARAETLTVA